MFKNDASLLDHFSDYNAVNIDNLIKPSVHHAYGFQGSLTEGKAQYS
jgi:hypothetical protein